jgi:hypothetical protein
MSEEDTVVVVSLEPSIAKCGKTLCVARPASPPPTVLELGPIGDANIMRLQGNESADLSGDRKGGKSESALCCEKKWPGPAEDEGTSTFLICSFPTTVQVISFKVSQILSRSRDYIRAKSHDLIRCCCGVVNGRSCGSSGLVPGSM